MLYQNRNMKNQKFEYDIHEQSLFNEYSDKSVTIKTGSKPGDQA